MLGKSFLQQELANVTYQWQKTVVDLYLPRLVSFPDSTCSRPADNTPCRTRLISADQSANSLL